MKVATQTITAPIVTALLYLLIFGHALEDYVQIYPGVGYTTFLVPGLVMMSLLQNSFANSSSSLIQSKINGSLVFILLAPISHWQLYLAYMLAAVVRGLIHRRLHYYSLVCPATASFAHLDTFLRLSRFSHSRNHGNHCRNLGRQIRSVGQLPEFPDYASHFLVRRLLHDSLVVGFLATSLGIQPVLLPRGRIPIRFFRPLGCQSLDKFLHSQHLFFASGTFSSAFIAKRI